MVRRPTRVRKVLLRSPCTPPTQCSRERVLDSRPTRPGFRRQVTQVMANTDPAHEAGPLTDHQPDPDRAAAVDASPTDVVAIDPRAATRAALAALPGRASDPDVCPFLRSSLADDRPPPATSDGVQHCVASSATLPVGSRQQALLCTVRAHEDCPRYRRGESRVRAGLAPALSRRRSPAPAVVLAAAFVIAAGVIAVASATRPSPPEGGGVAAGSRTSLPGSPPALTDNPRATDTPAPSSSLSPSPAAGPTPVPTVRPTLVPTRDLPAAYAGLTACPAPDTCYIYIARRRDTLYRIAGLFGTTGAALKRLNPTIDPSVFHVGDEIRVPPPE